MLLVLNITFFPQNVPSVTVEWLLTHLSLSNDWQHNEDTAMKPLQRLKYDSVYKNYMYMSIIWLTDWLTDQTQLQLYAI